MFKSILKRNKQLHRIARLFKRSYLLRGTQPNWSRYLQDDIDRPITSESTNYPKVLVATSMGGHIAGTTLESVLAVALSIRNVDVHVLLCDSVLPGCQEADISWFPTPSRFIDKGPNPDLCRNCYGPASDMYSNIGAKVHRFSEYLSESDRSEAKRLAATIPFNHIKSYKADNISIGEHAFAGALRYFASASLDQEATAEPVLRRYLEAAILTKCVVTKLLASVKFESAVFHHGIYVPQGIIGEVARQLNVRVINWNPAYRKNCFIFSHGDTYHHTLMTEPVSTWENIAWSPSIESRIMDYLKSRWIGSQDWIWFHDNPQMDLTKIQKEVGFDPTKPCIGLLTNVMWDAQLHYPANVFKNMLEWIIETIKYFQLREDLQLIVRVHPAEIRGTLKTRQPVVAEIQKEFPILPRNVFIISPESPVSTYSVMSCCNAVLIYGTKTGVELAAMGIPVIVAGEAWIRNKGLSYDATTKDDYLKLLSALPLAQRLKPEVVQRAKKYAFHFFFRRMIPVKFLRPNMGYPPYQLYLSSLSELHPGKDQGLDVICDGILTGSPFIYEGDQV